MKKTMLFVLLVLLVVLTGCTKKIEEPNKFKTDYEALNGTKNQKDVEYRSVYIDEKNPFVYTTAEDIVKKIENKETFYVYFGDEMCPWCRSVIENAIKVAMSNKIDKIYYVEIWDEDHTEVLRDTYTLDEKNKPILAKEGTDAYYKLLDYFKDYLSDYTLTTDKGKKVLAGEKRIYAPNFVSVVNGEAVKLVAGMSDLQTDPYGELDEKINSDQVISFTEFFTDAQVIKE